MRRRALLNQILMVIAVLVSGATDALARTDDGKEPSIVVREKVELEMENEITIDSIAEFHGLRDEVLQELRSVRLGDAPDVGESRTLTSLGLSQIFRMHVPKLQEALDKRITLFIPDRVIISRKTFKLQARDIEADIIRRLRAVCDACEFEIQRLRIPGWKEENLRVGSTWKIGMPASLPKGSFSLPLEVNAAGADRRMYWVNGIVRMYKRVAVAKRAIGIGERFSSEDFVIERKDVTFHTDSFPSADEMSGAVAARAIAVEQSISRSMIRREYALRAGQTVKVVTGNEAWQISIEGVSQQSGFAGDMVRVRVPRTQKILSGLLKENGIVEVR